MMEKIKSERILGKYTSNKKGPLLFVTAAVHGNEPSGIIALQEVFKTLEAEKPEINGTLIGVIGNTTALKKKVRFIDEDLNRTWTKKNIDSGNEDTNEKKEMLNIIETLNEVATPKETKRYFFDCHTTSSASLPYISVQDVNDNLKWSQQFPCYRIKGFSDIVSGTIDHYMSRKGLTGFVLEAGQHDSNLSPVFHEATIWIALKEACGLQWNALKVIPDAVTKLKKETPTPKTFEIIYRHGLEDDDTFNMQPGFENFQKIKKGQLLAVQNNKDIISDWDAYIFMPLYQSQGNDGFFIVSEV